ncbi:MAG: NAD-dependent dehydratase [Lentisphaerae bacterium RIFOXYB12_FULL_65_16]|nr:MAG: NAD-dependent dehydratase [Lentisphaerae bacterium RIFOXYA12_64_32]OGV91280.1 MAG: NAD-dependent dehydratase [Lentisphaerae bacterium RIFOXYB12_FULL_65_16]
MRTVVTGGAGFIGSHLVDRLIADGHEATVIDNFSTGRPDNLAHLKGNPRLRVAQADVAEFATIRPHFAGVDWVFHLAALADIVPSIQRPFDYHHANVDGTMSVLEAARAAGVKRFIYAASSSCYGIPDQYPTPETADARPQYPYALTKYVGEQYVMHWGKVYGLPVASLRMFNVYGPRSRTSGTYGAVFGVFLAQKLAGKPYTVVGDGAQTRDFTFVTDVAQAYVMAAASDLSGEIFNIGSGNTYSINRLVELLGGAVTHVPKRPGEPDCTFADTVKILRALGWRPRVSFEQGVAIMLENIEYWRQAPVWDPESIKTATQEWFQFLGRQTQQGRL